MPNTDCVVWICAVILQKKKEYMNMYGHILYIIIYGVSGIAMCLLCFFFRFLFLWNL